MGRLQRLIQFQYPTFRDHAQESYEEPKYVIGQAPLVRINVMNLIQRPPADKKTNAERTKIKKLKRRELLQEYGTTTSPQESGLLCAINTIGLDTDMGKRAIFEKKAGTVLPQYFSVSMDFFVIHEDTIGFDENGNSLLPNYPWDVWLKEPSSAEIQATEQSTAARTNMLLNNQAAEDIAKSRYSGLFPKRRARRDIKRAERRHYKSGGKDPRIQEGGFDYELAMQAQDYLDES